MVFGNSVDACGNLVPCLIWDGVNCNHINFKSLTREGRQMGNLRKILKWYEDNGLYYEYYITLPVCKPRLLWYFLTTYVYLLCYHKGNVSNVFLKKNDQSQKQINLNISYVLSTLF